MQRLGFLKHLVSRGSLTSTSTLRVLGDDLIQTLSKKVAVPITPELAQYVQQALTDGAYKPIRDAVERVKEQGTGGDSVNVELQDLYLASAELPSKRGKLAAKEWRKYPYLAVGLGLIRKESYSVLVRGQVFLKLVSPQEIAAFKNYSQDVNPLMLTTSQKLFFLFTLIEHDRDVLLPLYRELLSVNAGFSDREAGDLLPGIMRKAHQKLRPRVSNAADLARLQRLLETAGTIEQWRVRAYSGKGAREETVTPRLEPFVDLGVLAKDSPFSYRYQLTTLGRCLMGELAKKEDYDSELDVYFFAQATEAFGLSIPHLAASSEVLAALYESYRVLASPFGYAPIREVLLLAAISSINEGKGYFEMAEGLETLRMAQRERSEFVRLNVDRWGKVNVVKFLQ